MLARTLVLCSAGVIAGIAFVLACSDDSPSDADAAPVCDCPEAEPPLAGRIVVEEWPGSINVGHGYSSGAACNLIEGVSPPTLSGGCRIVDETIRKSGDVKLVESYKTNVGGQEGWICTYDNATTDTVEIMITLTCLLPAPAE